MYYVIAFYPTGTTTKIWVRTEERVIGLLKEGVVVYRIGTDQRPHLLENDKLSWIDVSEVKE